MSYRKIITAVLLLFVAASVVFLAVGEFGGTPDATDVTGATGAGETTGDVKTSNAAAATDAGDAVIAYYFHGYKRCYTCRTIEKYAKEALESGFPDEIRDGELVWVVVNVEEKENEHFVHDYELANKTVVLVEMEDGREKRWTQLNKVWELVEDKTSFTKYVQESAKDYLGD